MIVLIILGLVTKKIMVMVIIVMKALKKSIKSKSRNLAKFKKIFRNSITKIGLNFLIFATKKTFNQLQLLFIKTTIFYHFNREYHI